MFTGPLCPQCPGHRTLILVFCCTILPTYFAICGITALTCHILYRRLVIRVLDTIWWRRSPYKRLQRAIERARTRNRTVLWRHFEKREYFPAWCLGGLSVTGCTMWQLVLFILSRWIICHGLSVTSCTMWQLFLYFVSVDYLSWVIF